MAKISTLIFALIVLSGCTSMKPSDFSKAEPLLRIEDYFVGQTRAWGIFEDRFGNLRRQFVVDIQGSWDGESLVLDERFRYSDGESDRRVWTIKKIDEHHYEATASDVVGTAKGFSYGPAFKLEYVLLVPVKGKNMKIKFDDWIFMQDERVAINRATMTKFGIKVAELTVMFVKD